MLFWAPNKVAALCHKKSPNYQSEPNANETFLHSNRAGYTVQVGVLSARSELPSSSTGKAPIRDTYTEDDLMKKIGRLEIENDFLRSVSLACGLNPEKLK